MIAMVLAALRARRSSTAATWLLLTLVIAGATAAPWPARRPVPGSSTTTSGVPRPPPARSPCPARSR